VPAARRAAYGMILSAAETGISSPGVPAVGQPTYGQVSYEVVRWISISVVCMMSRGLWFSVVPLVAMLI
jgi:hypothetical protein